MMSLLKSIKKFDEMADINKIDDIRLDVIEQSRNLDSTGY